MPPRRSSISWPWFIVGCVLLGAALVAFFWAFSLGNITTTQRFLLMWLLPLTSGFACGCFAGSLKVSGPLGNLMVAATGGFAVWLLSFFLLPDIPAPPPPPPPQAAIVVTMDSPFRVYAPTGTGRTNSDEIYEALLGVGPLQIVKENTSLNWTRHEAVHTLDPRLIILHLSAFSDHTVLPESSKALQDFIQYMINTQTQFLFYSIGLSYDARQAPSKETEARMKEYVSSTTGAPLARTHVFMFPPGRPRDFTDLIVRQKLRQSVKEILHISSASLLEKHFTYEPVFLRSAAPNNRVQATGNSLRSFFALAISSA